MERVLLVVSPSARILRALAGGLASSFICSLANSPFELAATPSMLASISSVVAWKRSGYRLASAGTACLPLTDHFVAVLRDPSV